MFQKIIMFLVPVCVVQIVSAFICVALLGLRLPNFGIIGTFALAAILIIINYFLGIFTCLFVTRCFVIEKTWLKVVLYPVGGLLMLSIALGVTAPIGITGLVIWKFSRPS